jgi:cyclic beta-1,2-glucan synthetase
MLSSASFAAEHSGTRDRTLHVIEHLARRSRRTEMEVAQALLGLMKVPPVSGEADTRAEAAEAPQAAEATTAAHWLAGGGRDTLYRALGLHADHGLAWQAALRHAALPLYLAAVVLGTWALMTWILPPDDHGSATGYGAWIAPLVALLALLPASEVAVAVIHRLVSESTRPHKLSRLALVDGIPAEHRVMVVIPAMITNAATIDRLVHRLVLHWLANPERHAQFALLSDWADAPTEHAAGDEALLAYAVEQIRSVNARHPMPGHGAQVPRFILLHRQRTHCRSEQACDDYLVGLCDIKTDPEQVLQGHRRFRSGTASALPSRPRGPHPLPSSLQTRWRRAPSGSPHDLAWPGSDETPPPPRGRSRLRSA